MKAPEVAEVCNELSMTLALDRQCIQIKTQNDAIGLLNFLGHAIALSNSIQFKMTNCSVEVRLHS